MGQVIQIDFRKIDTRISVYVREKWRRGELSSDEIVGLLLAVEGVKFPVVPFMIEEPKDDVDYEYILSKFTRYDNPLKEVFAKFDQWLHACRIVKGEKTKLKKAKKALAKVMSNFA